MDCTHPPANQPTNERLRNKRAVPSLEARVSLRVCVCMCVCFLLLLLLLLCLVFESYRKIAMRYDATHHCSKQTNKAAGEGAITRTHAHTHYAVLPRFGDLVAPVRSFARSCNRSILPQPESFVSDLLASLRSIDRSIIENWREYAGMGCAVQCSNLSTAHHPPATLERITAHR